MILKGTKVWFPLSDLQNKVGEVGAYIGDGLFEVHCHENNKIYPVLFTEMKEI
jgi:hypothetical protein